MVIHIIGGKKLNGEIKIRAAKNSVLPIIAACALTTGTVVLKNCPPLLDIYSMLEIIKNIGGTAEFIGSDIVVNCADVTPGQIDKGLTGKIRSSFFILGPLLSRFRSAEISYPGGCEIGKRPIDIHLSGLELMGVKTAFEDGVIVCDGNGMKSAEIDLRLPSVGATENLMMAAVLVKGTTIIRGAAKEPEVEDLGNFINMLGGKVSGAGSGTIMIEGVCALKGGEYTPIPDRIVSGTYLTACALCGGKVGLSNVNFNHIYSTVDKLQAAGCRFNYKKNSITVISSGELKAVERTSTAPYPGFPTDMQPQLIAMLSVASGQSTVVENLFENRFKHTSQLKKMGADIEIAGDSAIINGVAGLKGANVDALDLRGGAALILAGLRAEGKTIVHGVEHIDRGYYKIEEDLKTLNADIKRI